MCIDTTNLSELDTNNRTRGHMFKLRSPKPRLDTRLHFFGYRVVSAWNSLSEAVVEAPSIISFKLLLNTEDLSNNLQYNYYALF